MVAAKIGVEAEHSDFPSEDFRAIVELINAHPGIDVDALVEVAKKYFRAGVRKGLRVSIRKMAEGHFTVGRKWLTVHDDTKFAARVKMPDGKQHRVTFTYTAENLGFRD